MVILHGARSAVLFSARSCKCELQSPELSFTHITGNTGVLLTLYLCESSTACTCHLTTAQVPIQHKLKVNILHSG